MIIIEGTDAVGKTSTINELKKEGIICVDRSKDMFSKYMLFDYSLEDRANKYYEYLKANNCNVIFLINNDKDELMRRIYHRNHIDAYDLDAFEYNKLYQETYNYMKKNNMLENKLFLVDVTNLNLKEQVKRIKEVILKNNLNK